MRVLFVLCALLAIAVTSLARPKNIDSANDKPTTAVPLVIATKNDSTNTTPAPIAKSTDKLASTISHTTPSVTIPDNQKDHDVKPDVTSAKPTEVATTNSKNDATTANTPTEKIVTVTKPTIPASTPTTTTDTTTSSHEVTTAIPPTTGCPPLPGRHFDGLSFLGGIILTVCLIGVGVFLSKYCQSIHEDKYRTL